MRFRPFPLHIQILSLSPHYIIKMTGYRVTFQMKYDRTNDDVTDQDPTPEELEAYVAESTIIPENPTYMDALRLTSPVEYIGGLTFRFTCETALLPVEIADLFIHQSLADGEWGAAPGQGSFVYPTRDLNNPEELGLLSFLEVKVKGKAD